MNVVIVGIGEVGSHIARVLIGEGHNVTLVEEDPAAVARAEEEFDAMIVTGHGASPRALRQAGTADADLFVAVSSTCEVNLVAAITARSLGAKRTIARVSNPGYFDEPRGIVSNMLGIDIVINPMFQIAAEIRRLVRSRSALAVQDFADHQIEMVQLPVEADTRVVGRPLKDLRLPEQSIVVCILRGEELIVPGGNDTLLPGDEALLVGRIDSILDIEKAFHRRKIRFGRRAMIVGGGLIAQSVARALEADDFAVTLLEKDRERCQELSSALESTVVLHADATNSALLEEEGVAQVDVFIALSDEDEVNLMASLLAKSLGCRRCMALVHRPDYAPVCERLGIDTTLSPRLTVAQQVLKYVSDGQLISVLPIKGGRAEFIEFIVARESRIAETRLSDSLMPRGALVCAVLGAQGALVPNGDYVFHAGDQVVVFALHELRSRIERLFRKQTLGFRS